MSGAMSGAGPSQARLLEVRGLNSYYGDSHILFDVSLRVERNEVVALLGRNGAGKSTTLKSLMGVVTPRAGSVLLDGVEIAEPGLLEKAGQHVGTMINAAAFVVVVFLVVFFGLRPLAASLGKPAAAAVAAPSFDATVRSLPVPEAEQAAAQAAIQAAAQPPSDCPEAPGETP